MPNPVTEPGFARPDDARDHYLRRLTLETDCADVSVALQSGDAGFVLVDTRSAQAYADRHVPGAVTIPNAEMTPDRLSEYPTTTRFVTYCWGPHCNGASRGAAHLAGLGFAVKEMLGGMWGWEQEGHAFACGPTPEGDR
jgi:rhodanese-related sulfurtransferase